jgi:hypothetical protein
MKTYHKPEAVVEYDDDEGEEEEEVSRSCHELRDRIDGIARRLPSELRQARRARRARRQKVRDYMIIAGN